MIRCLDSLQAFLVAGFRRCEQAGAVGHLGDGCRGGTRRPEAMTAQDWAEQFRLDLHHCGISDVEEACLWARYQLEGQPGEERSQATAVDMARFIDRYWRWRITAGALKVAIAKAERKLMQERPWREERQNNS